MWFKKIARVNYPDSVNLMWFTLDYRNLNSCLRNICPGLTIDHRMRVRRYTTSTVWMFSPSVWHHLMRYSASLWRRITRVSGPPQICPGLTSDWPQNAGHFTQVHACYYTIRVTAINSPDLKYCKGDREENVNFLQWRQRTRQESHEMSDCCLQSMDYDLCRDYAVNMQSTIRLNVAWILLYVKFFFSFKKVC